MASAGAAAALRFSGRAAAQTPKPIASNIQVAGSGIGDASWPIGDGIVTNSINIERPTA
jgi:hypothetical protein